VRLPTEIFGLARKIGFSKGRFVKEPQHRNGILSLQMVRCCTAENISSFQMCAIFKLFEEITNG